MLTRRGIMAHSDESKHMGTVLAYITGFVNQELVLQNEYLEVENRILRWAMC
jgi:hypothetical protein